MKMFGSWFKFFVVGLLMGVAGVMPVTNSYATDGSSGDNIQITLSPTSVHEELKPGETRTGTFKLINSGARPFNAKVYASPYQVNGEDYEPVFGSDIPQTQVSRWVKFSQEIFSLKPNQTVEVKYEINVPKDIPAVGQYAALFAETTGEEDNGGAVITKKRVGMILYGKVSGGDTRQSGELISSDVAFWQQNRPLSSKIRVKNTGNTDFMSYSKFKVKNFFGGKVRYESQNLDHAVLPDTVRAINLEWNDATIGLYKVEIESQILGKTEIIEKTVLMAPFWLLAVILILLLIIIGGIVYAIFKKRRTKTPQE